MQRLSVAIAVGTIPAAIAGGLGASFFEDTLGEPWMIALQLIFFGALLLFADRLPQRKSLEGSTVKDGLYIGLAQILALAPGTSRSGITITAARYLGLDRDAAARFSFLLLIPVVTGAALYKGVEAVHEGLPSGVAGPMIVGTIAAAVSGYLAIAFLLRLVRTASYAALRLLPLRGRRDRPAGDCDRLAPGDLLTPPERASGPGQVGRLRRERSLVRT